MFFKIKTIYHKVDYSGSEETESEILKKSMQVNSYQVEIGCGALV